MKQLNLLEMNDVFVSTGDPERDSLIKLSKMKNEDIFWGMVEIMRANLELDFAVYRSDSPHNNIYDNGYIDTKKLSMDDRYTRAERTLGYFDKNCQLWVAKLGFERHWSYELGRYLTSQIHISEFKKSDKFHRHLFAMNSDIDLRQKLEKFYPYAYKLWEEKYNQPIERYERYYSGYKPADGIRLMLMMPQLEQLLKAGYRFAEKIMLHEDWLKDTEEDYINRLCKKGKNLKEIFKTPKVVYETLKDETSLEYWDTIRRMFKNGTISQDTVAQVVDSRFDKRDIENISYILRQEHNNKKVFTFDSLMNYLRRIDMYEAIGNREAFMLLRDYLRMCRLLETEPKLDGDSLKREHDVTARTLRNKHDEIMEQKLNKSCEYLSEYNYEDDDYLIRGIESYADLIDEAKQQHNCVASYADNIASRRSLIYVMRRKISPNKSLVTVELSPNLKEIRQKFLAYNQPIRDKSISDFLDNWLKFIKKKEETK